MYGYEYHSNEQETSLCCHVMYSLGVAVALVVLPESPRWLVVNAQLDEALAVIHRHASLPVPLLRKALSTSWHSPFAKGSRRIFKALPSHPAHMSTTSMATCRIYPSSIH